MHYATGGKSRLRSGVFLRSCLILLNVLGLCACAITPIPRSSAESPVEELLKKRLERDVAFLTELVPSRSAANVASLNKAAEYIAQEFTKTGCRLEEQHFPVEYGTYYRNIICSFGPVEGERVIVGAHYDVCCNLPGADDNASGVAGILELARMVHREKPALARRLDLVAYTLEEPPYFQRVVTRDSNMGSYHHAKYLADRKVPVKLMMSLEMIGYFNPKEYPDFPLNFLYPHEGAYIAVVGNWGQNYAISRVSRLMAQENTIDVVSMTAPTSMIDLSDHINYWYFGYPAVMVTDTADYRNHNYHKDTDTIGTLDFTSMAGVVKGVYKVIMDY